MWSRGPAADPAAHRLLDPVGLDVDVLLHLARQLCAVGGRRSQVSGEHVRLLEVGVGESQDLGEERIEPDVVGELTAELCCSPAGARRGAGPPARARYRRSCVALLSKYTFAKPSTSGAV